MLPLRSFVPTARTSRARMSRTQRAVGQPTTGLLPAVFLKAALFRAALLGAVLLAPESRADTPALPFDAAASRLPDGGARVFSHLSKGQGAPLLLRTRDRAVALAQGLVPISDTLAVTHRPRSSIRALTEVDGIEGVFLASLRYPLLDRAGETIHLGEAQNDSGLLGEGTIIGVVDTGSDPSHPALRDENGGSRVAWYLIFGQQALGLYPDLEAEYGCLGEDPCAVLGRAEIDSALLRGADVPLPSDAIGHATHITSLAAGRDDEYPGVAPNSDLILVGAANPEGGVSDARILLGTKFVFDRAQEMGLPAVVNVSLGSSFGAHDGTAFVEQGLADLGKGPGRAIVLASGNSGHLLRGISSDYPAPFGVKVPLLSPPGAGQTLTGTLFVWISTQPGDEISVGFSNGRKGETVLIEPGSSGAISSEELEDPDDFDVVLLNGVDEGLGANVAPGSAVIAIVGSWQSGRAFELLLEGHGTARLWVTGSGDFTSAERPFGPLFPRAVSFGTVAVPGSHPELITVGASVNRNEWRDFSGELIGYGGRSTGRADFSAAGPNQNGAMKPELVAPGGGVIGAMARAADPRRSVREVSQFSSRGACPDGRECLVIDDTHGIASGTSMAAPLVAGTVALMMQRDPTLTMTEAKHYLMAGTRALETESEGSMTGTGELDVVGTLLAQETALTQSEEAAEPSRCRVVWANDFVYPGTGPALSGYLVTRNRAGEPVKTEDADLSFRVEGPGRVTHERVSPGLVALRVTADDGTASGELTIESRVNGETVARDTFVIERDPSLAKYGYELTGGTCSVVSPAQRSRWGATFPALLTLALSLVRVTRRVRHRP
jgi:subtilisin family serine protease